MQRDKFFGFDPAKKWAFVFLFEKNDKVLSLFVEYTTDENLTIIKQDLAMYALFWDSGSTIEEVIDLFNFNPTFKNLNLKGWTE